MKVIMHLPDISPWYLSVYIEGEGTYVLDTLEKKAHHYTEIKKLLNDYFRSDKFIEDLKYIGKKHVKSFILTKSFHYYAPKDIQQNVRDLMKDGVL